MSTPARDDDLIAAARVADLRQAEYFRCELLNECEQLDDRMMTHRIALAKYESRDELPQIHRMRRVIRLDERERDTLRRLLEALNESFPRLARL